MNSNTCSHIILSGT